jgi:hypothetical protein
VSYSHAVPWTYDGFQVTQLAVLRSKIYHLKDKDVIFWSAVP